MKVKINGKLYNGNTGETLMELAKRNNIYIPNLCHKKGFEGQGRCRLCIVEINDGGKTKIVSSCVYPIKDGIEVSTNSDKIIKIRKNIILLLLLRTPNNDTIKSLAKEYNVDIHYKYLDNKKKENCILCGLCVEACDKLGTKAISLVNRGTTKKVSTPYDDASKDCIGCAACVEVCPTDAISIDDKNGKRTIWNRTFNLVSCSICGKYFTTYEALKYTDDKLNIEKENQICNSCKRKEISKKFKESFKNTY
ncbi:2Fe-2S iron-sulfur cluster-binding protein [Sedimentibacter sp. MB31-C6]|uniref:2Fe-2S iron-sulfur cluster-binding protein n=1 Tax=Sedimentibacter sp. MB31-C6 TaxID=3109366 RepID=UPI002DDD7922|nr:2Fe-2S iron-sulfur cluster-binding protein [Sedimentibacter sp. MB36-C1]WSI04681.1 2Fe-2S iron-sulfur cluster-binding protein [Sedimentibacter sp. MB36-C1]